MKRVWLFVVGAVAVVGGVAIAIAEWRAHSGASVSDLADARLDVTADDLAKALPASVVEHREVETRLRHDVVEFEEAKFTFCGPAQHVCGVRLVREKDKEEKTRKSGHDDGLDQRFAARLENASENEMKRGNVTFRLGPTELAFAVETRRNGDDARQDTQVAVARDVLLSIAFGSPPKHTDRQVADALGTGYAVAEVARANVTSDPKTMDALMAQFPGSTRKDDSVRIPLVHPLVEDVEAQWKVWSTPTPYLHVGFHMTKAFRDHHALAACIAKQPAADLLEVREGYGVGTIDEHTAPRNFASLLQAVDACR